MLANTTKVLNCPDCHLRDGKMWKVFTVNLYVECSFLSFFCTVLCLCVECVLCACLKTQTTCLRCRWWIDSSFLQVTSKPIVIYPNSGEAYDADKKKWVVSFSPWFPFMWETGNPIFCQISVEMVFMPAKLLNVSNSENGLLHGITHSL